MCRGLPNLQVSVCCRGPDWRADPSHDLLREIGSEWIESGASLAIAVPSAVSPTEVNYLLNPSHPDFRTVTISKAAPVEWDLRLFKRLRLDER